MNPCSVAVIGGGPAGLFCALRAAGSGRRVIVLEKKASPGRKLLLSGSGQCNLTHDGDIGSFLSRYGDNGGFLKPALMNFGNRDLIAFFEERGVPTAVESDGKVFPASRKAADVLNALTAACSASGVEIRSGDPVVEIAIHSGRFLVRTDGTSYAADRTVIATGGITYPATGSTGGGYAMARGLGHRVTETGPALCAVQIKDHPFSDLAGISFRDRTISILRDGRRVRRHTGDLLFTHAGLSGPGILDFSRFIRAGDTLEISFLPDFTPETIEEALLGWITEAGQRKIGTILAAHDLPERFAHKLLAAAGLDPDSTGAHLTKTDRAALIKLLTGWPLAVSQLGSIHEAMITRGGVTLDEVNPKTMESRLVPRLFFVGEVLDIDGDTGGYNLQAAFSTAALAAKRIAGTAIAPGPGAGLQ
ncbi:MAG: NAD(P)/FAD-dependent oxidoreductase [Acidobacteriota bacterium]|nr:NAD(P)/FAD-dependent oxidoreductase [Acidobacteriota bacterium]